MPSQSMGSPLPVIGVIVGSFVMAAALVAIGRQADEPPPPAQPASATAAAPKPTPTPTRTPTPSATSPSPSYLEAMLAIVIAQVPSGYTVPTARVVNGIQVQTAEVYPMPDGGGQYSAGTEVYGGGETGYLAVRVVVGPSAIQAADNPCSVPGLQRQGFEEGCHVVIASNGVKVRVSYRNRGGFRLVDVFAVYPGVTVWAVWSPMTVSDPDHPMAESVLSEEQLVELAAMPAFLPP